MRRAGLLYLIVVVFFTAFWDIYLQAKRGVWLINGYGQG